MKWHEVIFRPKAEGSLASYLWTLVSLSQSCRVFNNNFIFILCDSLLLCYGPLDLDCPESRVLGRSAACGLMPSVKGAPEETPFFAPLRPFVPNFIPNLSLSPCVCLSAFLPSLLLLFYSFQCLNLSRVPCPFCCGGIWKGDWDSALSNNVRLRGPVDRRDKRTVRILSRHLFSLRAHQSSLVPLSPPSFLLPDLLLRIFILIMTQI
jgi:hypothetical protein